MVIIFTNIVSYWFYECFSCLQFWRWWWRNFIQLVQLKHWRRWRIEDFVRWVAGVFQKSQAWWLAPPRQQGCLIKIDPRLFYFLLYTNRSRFVKALVIVLAAPFLHHSSMNLKLMLLMPQEQSWLLLGPPKSFMTGWWTGRKSQSLRKPFLPQSGGTMNRKKCLFLSWTHPKLGEVRKPDGTVETTRTESDGTNGQSPGRICFLDFYRSDQVQTCQHLSTLFVPFGGMVGMDGFFGGSSPATKPLRLLQSIFVAHLSTCGTLGTEGRSLDLDGLGPKTVIFKNCVVLE